MRRTVLFSVTIHDCRVDTFTVGGNGGAGKDTSNTGVRVVHEPSGAVGESREERSQLQNKIRAFRRMAETKKFRCWIRVERARRLGEKTIDELVDEAMQPHHLLTEVHDERGRWQKAVDILPDFG